MIMVYKGVAHPWLCDVMGHMTTRHYVAMFDDASYHFLSEVFGWAPGTAGGPGWADVKHTIAYKDEVAAGDLLEVRGSLAKIGGKSITVDYELHNLTKRVIAASLESISVYFDLTTRQAITIPDALRTRTQAFLPTGEAG
ncbi:acyl-CoA thioesterase [Hyphomonas sp.]|uniref:acyl-CoA thioesterase n=1 Tax=Hyphomonas sp. TaxID=87 RepID=UPI00356953F5